jgi:hypothetical protein
MEVREVLGFMPRSAGHAWFAANDWVERPIRGRGVLYRAAGPGLRRFGLGPMLARYWTRRLLPFAREGVTAPVAEAGGMLIVEERV